MYRLLIKSSFFFLLLSVSFSDEKNYRSQNIEFDLHDGKKINLTDLLDEGPLVLQFWATWCAPCKKEMYHLDKIQKKFKNKGVNVLCVNTDKIKSIPKAKAFIKQKRYDMLVALDPSLSVYRKLSVALMPTLMIFDKGGNIVFRKEGYISGDEREIEKNVEVTLSNS